MESNSFENSVEHSRRCRHAETTVLRAQSYEDLVRFSSFVFFRESIELRCHRYRQRNRQETKINRARPRNENEQFSIVERSIFSMYDEHDPPRSQSRASPVPWIVERSTILPLQNIRFLSLPCSHVRYLCNFFLRVSRERTGYSGALGTRGRSRVIQIKFVNSSTNATVLLQYDMIQSFH